MKENLVSIIVPIYNAQSYLNKCLGSLLRQSHTALEIILVDDGSTDGCPGMCDDLAERDKRIVVIHKSNGGLSSARNAGLDIARGTFIMFVDSDDFVDSDIVEYLLGLIKINNCDIATSHWSKKFMSHDVTCDSAGALKLMLLEQATSLHSWGKLYKKELFRHIRFPEGRIFEDVATTYKLVSRAKRVAIGSKKKYHYLVRSSSISNTDFTPKRMDFISHANEMHEHIKEMHPSIIKHSRSYLFKAACGTLSMILASHATPDVDKYINSCFRLIEAHRVTAILDRKVGKKFRILALTSYLGKGPLNLILKPAGKMRAIRKENREYYINE